MTIAYQFALDPEFQPWLSRLLIEKGGHVGVADFAQFGWEAHERHALAEIDTVRAVGAVRGKRLTYDELVGIAKEAIVIADAGPGNTTGPMWTRLWSALNGLWSALNDRARRSIAVPDSEFADPAVGVPVEDMTCRNWMRAEISSLRHRLAKSDEQLTLSVREVNQLVEANAEHQALYVQMEKAWESASKQRDELRADLADAQNKIRALEHAIEDMKVPGWEPCPCNHSLDPSMPHERNCPVGGNPVHRNSAPPNSSKLFQDKTDARDDRVAPVVEPHESRGMSWAEAKDVWCGTGKAPVVEPVLPPELYSLVAASDDDFERVVEPEGEPARDNSVRALSFREIMHTLNPLTKESETITDTLDRLLAEREAALAKVETLREGNAELIASRCEARAFLGRELETVRAELVATRAEVNAECSAHQATALKVSELEAKNAELIESNKGCVAKAIDAAASLVTVERERDEAVARSVLAVKELGLALSASNAELQQLYAAFAPGSVKNPREARQHIENLREGGKDEALAQLARELADSNASTIRSRR